MRTISRERKAGSRDIGFRSCTAIGNLRWRSSVAVHALDQFCVGLIVADDCGRVVEMNRAGQAMVRFADGLVVHNGRLSAGRAFETARIAKLITAAATAGKTGAAAGRMLIGRADGRPAYVLTVAPLRRDLALGGRPLAMIVVVDPERHRPGEGDLVELFGLSPAEARLAAALMTGKKLSEIAGDFGVRVPTLRTQLGSFLRKVDAERQSDLLRISDRYCWHPDRSTPHWRRYECHCRSLAYNGMLKRLQSI